jgi:5'-nucleotidase
MHLLLTNDDGINAAGIRAMAVSALAAGHKVTVCAPSSQQSATSHRITLSSPLMMREKHWEGARAYAIDGTPADCVRLAPCLADGPIDCCISGINDGENAGTAVYYSGTVSAAREAAMMYLPAMAVSIERDATEEMLLNFGAIALKIADKLCRVSLPRLCVCNLNAPARPPALLKPLRVAPLSQSFYLDGYERRVSPYGNTYFWMEAGAKAERADEGSDLAFLQDGHVTCTFIGPYSDFGGEFASVLQD